MGRRNHRIRGVVLSVAAWCLSGSHAFGQSQGQFQIRIESDEVLVPTFAFAKPSGHQSPTFVWQDRAGRTLVNGLTAGDFHLFEDGVEQKIERVTTEHWGWRIVRDNATCHKEDFSTPGARWISGQSLHPPCPTLPTATYYQIAYRPPPASEGSCHQVSVAVDRPNVVAEARGVYCRTPYSSSDILNGTGTGQRLQELLESGKPGKFEVSVQAGIFHTRNEESRVHIALNLPWDKVKKEWKKGRLWSSYEVLGVIYRTDGSVAERFSEDSDFNIHPVPGSGAEYQSEEMLAWYLPHTYERQIDLPPGDYTLRVIFSDSVKFGWAAAPLSVKKSNPGILEISSLLLANRYQQASAAPNNDGPRILPGGFVPLLSRETEITPSGNTRFTRGEQLAVYFEVYEAEIGGSPAANVAIHLRIVDAKTGETQDVMEPFDATPDGRAGRPVVPIARTILTKNLKRGSYRLEAQATDSAGSSTAWRSASFTLE